MKTTSFMYDNSLKGWIEISRKSTSVDWLLICTASLIISYNQFLNHPREMSHDNPCELGPTMDENCHTPMRDRYGAIPNRLSFFSARATMNVTATTKIYLSFEKWIDRTSRLSALDQVNMALLETRILKMTVHAPLDEHRRECFFTMKK